MNRLRFHTLTASESKPHGGTGQSRIDADYAVPRRCSINVVIRPTRPGKVSVSALHSSGIVTRLSCARPDSALQTWGTL